MSIEDTGPSRRTTNVSHDMPGRIGPFEVEQGLSAGGMGQLYVAHHIRRPNIRVVIKVPHQDTKAGFDDTSMWQQEAERLNELRHPNIVRICRFEAENRQTVLTSRAFNLPGTPLYYVMEYIPSGDLKSHLPTVREFSFGWRLELFYQILIGMDYMHAMGWAHCDLKPANLLFRAPPDKTMMPRPVLIDFGSVSPVNRLSHLVGTVCYAAPEMLEALRRPDVKPDYVNPRRADIWSLGAILFEIVSGRPMVDAKDFDAAASSTIRGKFDDLVEVAPDAPATLSLLVKRMTDKEAMQRPLTKDIIQIIERDIRFPPFFRAAA
jgi:eukaryotic-like serine/threonine-protein kinase